jgi:hypothetical protein
MSEPTITTPAALPPAPPAPSKRRRWPWIVGGSVAVLITIGIVSGSAAQHSVQPVDPSGPVTFQNDTDAISDVTVAKCAGGPEAGIGMAQVTVKITNHTDQVQSYLITASVNDAQGNRLTEANGASNSVAPGQTATADLLGGSTEGMANASSCTIASVTRIAQ